jgi:hypothetical protein
MICQKATLRAFLILCLLAGFPGCKKSPTEAPIDVDEPTISLTCNPVTAAKDEVVSVSVFIKNNTKELRVFGLETAFDSGMFQYQEVRRGTLTGGWAEVDGNEVGPGSLRVGGFSGSGATIPVSSEGTLAEIRLKVTGGDYGNGHQSQVCVEQYTDDLAEFKPASACSTFTLKK